MTYIDFWQEYQKFCRTFSRRCSLCPLNNKCIFNSLHDMKPINEEMLSNIFETISLSQSGISMTIDFTIKTSPFIRGMIECNDNTLEDTFENFFYTAVPLLHEYNIFVIPGSYLAVDDYDIEKDGVSGTVEVDFNFLYKDDIQQSVDIIENIISKKLKEDGVENTMEINIRE